MVGRTAVAATEQNPANSAGESSATSKLLTPEFKDYAKDLMSEWNNPGVSLAVIDEEDVYAEV
jgi:CubicO group peptidase (beta-lactamase class C family)